MQISKILAKIFNKEKRDLGIDLPLTLQPTTRRKHMSTSVRDGKIVLSFNPKRKVSEEELKIRIRHELCHVLDYLEGKIKFESKIHSGPSWLPPLELEIDWAYKDYITSKRYINLFGAEELRKFNSIGLEEFLSEASNKLCVASNRNEWLLNIFTLFKEAVKNYMINDLREGFPRNIWKIAEWLIEDFEYINSSTLKWEDKSDLLNLTVFCIMNGIELNSVFLGGSLQPFSNPSTFQNIFFSKYGIHADDYLIHKWMKRLSDLTESQRDWKQSQ